MDEARLKFSGTFTLEDTEAKQKYSIPAQIVYQNEHHVIIIYEFGNLVQPPWVDAILTGIIAHFDLDVNNTRAIASNCHILAPDEEEPEGAKVFPIHYRWVNGRALVNEIEEYKDDSTEES